MRGFYQVLGSSTSSESFSMSGIDTCNGGMNELLTLNSDNRKNNDSGSMNLSTGSAVFGVEGSISIFIYYHIFLTIIVINIIFCY